MVRTEYFLEHWQTIREDVAQAVESMPADRLDYRPQDDMMGFREVAVHILEVGHCFTGVLLDGETDFSTPDFRQKLIPYKPAVPEDQAGLAEALRSSVKQRCAEYRQKPPEIFTIVTKKWDGTQPTHGEMLQFLKEHEIAHRMQMFVYLRMNGIVPPTTQRKLAGKRA